MIDQPARQGYFYEITLCINTIVDPYASDFHFEVYWTRPDKTVVQAPGFYDGGDIFRARAYTNQAGRWQWRSVASVSSLNNATGSFFVAASNLPGKLQKHSQDPFQFQYENGDWFLHIADTAYRFVNMDEKNWKQYLDQANEVGFSKIRTWFNSGRYDVQALFDSQRKKLNLEYWQEIDRRLRYALKTYPRLQFQLIPYGEDTEEIRKYANNKMSRRIASYAQARFSAYANVQWCISNDREIVEHGPLSGRQILASTIEKIGNDMAAQEPWESLITNHQARYEGYSFVDSNWSDIITLEDLDQVGGDLLRTYRSKSSNDAVVLEEDRYEYYKGAKHPGYFFRRLFWSGLFAGGHVTYGGLASYEAGEAGNDIKGVQGYLDAKKGSFPLRGADQFQYIHKFFSDSKRTLVGFYPQQSWVKEGSKKLAVMTNGSDILIYIANPASEDIENSPASSQPFSFELTLPDEGIEFSLLWFNPRNGEWLADESLPRSSRAIITTPVGGDWVASIQRK